MRIGFRLRFEWGVVSVSPHKDRSTLLSSNLALFISRQFVSAKTNQKTSCGASSRAQCSMTHESIGLLVPLFKSYD